MIPPVTISPEEKELFSYLSFWLMYSVHTHEENSYIEKKNEAKAYFNDTLPWIVDKMERKILNSGSFNTFLISRGVPARGRW